MMELTVTSVDYAPPELNEQVPFRIKLLRLVPGPDRPGYWIGEVVRPLRWISDNHETEVENVVVCARWQGTKIAPFVQNLPIGIAYVTDHSLLGDPGIDFGKCKYVAIGVAHETEDKAEPLPSNGILAGRIDRAFGFGKKSE